MPRRVRFADRVDETGTEALRCARILVWNTILGLLFFFFANAVFRLGIPYLSWPILLPLVLGVPGALLGILLWVFLS